MAKYNRTVLFTDACHFDGVAGIAVVTNDNEVLVSERGEYANSVAAEKDAVTLAVAISLDADHPVQIRTDCTSALRVKRKGHISIKWIPRGQNTMAHREARRVRGFIPSGVNEKSKRVEQKQRKKTNQRKRRKAERQRGLGHPDPLTQGWDITEEKKPPFKDYGGTYPDTEGRPRVIKVKRSDRR